MKNIKFFRASKYSTDEYKEIVAGVFQIGQQYVMSISFEQEPDLDEGNNAADISQYPLEDILDKFFVYVSDFYPELNKEDSEECYLEFSSDDIEDIKKLSCIIGKHVYNKDAVQNGDVYSVLVIE